jgi:hypothetical protein
MKKRLFYLTIAIGFLAASCSKETVSADSTNTADSQVPTTVITYATLESAVMMSDSITIPDTLIIRRKLTPLAVDSLPAAIKDYLSANYSGAVLKKAGVDSVGNYYVGVLLTDSTRKGLLFDASGTFVAELKLPAHHRHGGKGGRHGGEMRPDSGYFHHGDSLRKELPDSLRRNGRHGRHH